MNWINFQRQGYELTEKEIAILTKGIIENYRQLNIKVDVLIKEQYLRYLSSVDTVNYYNELIKYNRLTNLKAEISSIYLSYDKINRQLTKQILETGFSEMFNRQMFTAQWLIPSLAIRNIPKDLMLLAVNGTVQNWKKITQGMIKRYGDLSLYQPMTGTLVELLKYNSQIGLRTILSELSQGLVSGQSYTNMTRNLRRVIGQTILVKGEKAYSGGLYNTLRIIHTESNRVMNDAVYAQSMSLEADGHEIYKMWIATLDTRTRDTHASLDGKKVKPDEEFIANDGDRALSPGNFSQAGNNINCFMDDNFVCSVSKIKKIYRRHYEGLIYRFKTASGIEFSCTPNHPIFTPNGWVGANSFKKGDEIFKITYSKPFVRSKPKINNIPIIFEKMFYLFNIRYSFKRTTTIKKNFHGDGVINGDVDIIFIKSKLMNWMESIFFKIIKNFDFTFPSIALSKLFTFSTFRQVRNRPFNSFNGCMSRLSLVKSFFYGHLFPFKKFCLAFISLSKSHIVKMSNYCNSCNIKFIRNLFNRHTIFMESDKIVEINICNFSGHVYNLETKDNKYLVNSNYLVNNNFAVVHNCRCSLGETIDDFSPSIRRGRNPVTGENEVFSYKDYDQWAKDNGLKKVV